MIKHPPFYNWSAYTVLIVEDDVSSTFYLKEVLKDTTVNVLHAPDGAQAVELCKKHPEICLVLMDIRMPVMNGFDATREIKKIRPGIVIIVQTAIAIYENQHLCIEAGCDDIILKPFDPIEMLEKISAFLK